MQAALGDTAVTTATVMAELHRGEALDLVMQVDWTWLPQVELTPAEQKLAAQLLQVLDAGVVIPEACEKPVAQHPIAG